VTDLAGVREAGGDLAGLLSGSRRQRVRRSLRAFGDLEDEWCDAPAAAVAALDELAALNRARWSAAEEATPFSDGRFVAFHRSLIERLAPMGAAWIFRVRSADSTVAALYCFADGPRVLFYQSGLSAFADNRLRPGIAAHARSINACAARGYDVYDFLAPADRYKRELATGEEPLVWVSHDRPSPAAPLRRAARALRARRRGR
jgi:CelD/BcsL family acetyltransferase involved in cellulose biosynthesis